MPAWQYFGKEAKPAGTPEIFTDVESKIARYKRVLTYLGFFYFLMIVTFGITILTDIPYPW